MTVVSNIPTYHSYKDIYVQFLLGWQIHECLTHRLSNDAMFVGNNDRLRLLYSEMSKLYVILETLSELFNDNPLYDCDTSITDDDYVPNIVDDAVKEKYIGYFNKLYNCLRVTINSIKTCKKGLSVDTILEGCNIEYTTGDSNIECECLPNDFNMDYSCDFWINTCGPSCATCTDEPIDTSHYIYAGTSSLTTLTALDIQALSDYADNRASIVGTYNMSAGDYKYLAYPSNMTPPTNFISSGIAMAMWDGYSNTVNGYSYDQVDVNGVIYNVFRSYYPLGGSLIMEVE